MLLNRGAEVSAKTDRCATPQHIAATYSRPEITSLLVARSADVHGRDERKHTPWRSAMKRLYVISGCTHDPEVVALLLELDADMNA